MNPLDIAAMFALGLAGSIHCVQMCGPIVLSFSIPLSTAHGKSQFSAQACHHAGRLSTYALLGAAAGWVGGGVEWAGRLAGLAHAGAIVAGVVMIIAGLQLSGAMKNSSLVQITPSRSLTRYAGRMLLSPAASSRLGMGMLLGFLPCGLIYAALLKSMTGGSPLAGASEMFFFGLGTAGPLTALGLFSGRIGRRLAGSGPKLAAVWVVVMGVAVIWRGLLPATAAAHCH